MSQDHPPAEELRGIVPRMGALLPRSIWSMMAIVAVAAVVSDLFARPEDLTWNPIILGLLCAAIFSPIYLPFILMFVPPAIARRLFRRVGIGTALVVVSSCTGVAATDDLGYSIVCSTIGFCSIFLALAFDLGYLASWARARLRKHRG